MRSGASPPCTPMQLRTAVNGILTVLLSSIAGNPRMPIGMSTCYLIRYNQTMPLAAAIQNPEPPPRLRQEALLASPDQLPKYCHQSPLLTAPGASQSFHPPPTSQRFEQISAVVIPKARTLRQPSASYPLNEPKAFHNFCHVLCSYLSRK